MAEDPYQVLGVPRTADAEAIRRAYRTLAKRYHPDLNPGDAAAEARFKSVAAANALLSDPDTRARYDRGEIDAAGDPKPETRSYRDYADAAGRSRYRPAGASAAWSDNDFGDIFGGMFADAARGPHRGQTVQYQLTIGLLDALTGATQRLTLPEGGTLDVKIPAGLDDGETIRLRGKGGSGVNGGPDGDALIQIHVAPHGHFRREGNDVHLDLPVSLSEAVLGARVTVPTPGGPVTMTVPPNSDSGQRLRLRGRGVPARQGRAAGDFYVTLQIRLGGADPALAKFLRDNPGVASTDPRAELMAEVGS